jgi:hypothetical protein
MLIVCEFLLLPSRAQQVAVILLLPNWKNNQAATHTCFTKVGVVRF